MEKQFAILGRLSWSLYLGVVLLLSSRGPEWTLSLVLAEVGLKCA